MGSRHQRREQGALGDWTLSRKVPVGGADPPARPSAAGLSRLAPCCSQRLCLVFVCQPQMAALCILCLSYLARGIGSLSRAVWLSQLLGYSDHKNLHALTCCRAHCQSPTTQILGTDSGCSPGLPCSTPKIPYQKRSSRKGPSRGSRCAIWLLFLKGHGSCEPFCAKEAKSQVFKVSRQKYAWCEKPLDRVCVSMSVNGV